MGALDKRELIRRACEEIARSVEVLTKAAKDAREAATHEDAKPENDKDTRAVEAAYLAGAQADRVRDLERTAAALSSLDLRKFAPGDAIASSALVELDHDGTTVCYFLAPQGGGLRVLMNGVEVQVITPLSPMGRELLGKSEGDEIEVRAANKQRTYEIVRVY